MKKADEYKNLSPEDHFRARPQMYIGSCKQTSRKEWALVDGKSVLITTTTPAAIFQVIKEFVGNIGDNVINSRKAGIDPGKSIITVKRGKITMSNQGLSIPIEKAKGKDKHLYIPEMIFGTMHSGSNLGDGITGGGAHGIGGKAGPFTGKRFFLRILNPVQKKSYEQTWTDQGRNKTQADIQPYDGKKSLVHIEYEIDQTIFEYAPGKFSYTEDDINIMKWICVSLSFSCRIKIHFNDEVLEYNDRDYAMTYYSGDNSDEDEFPKHIIFTQTVQQLVKSGNSADKKRGKKNTDEENSDDGKKKRRTGKNAKEEDEGEYRDVEVECIILDTPNKGKRMGIVNNIVTVDGGEHIKYVLSLLKQHIQTTKIGELASKSGVDFTITNLKPHITIIVNIMGLVRPEWGSGQLKTTLTNLPIEFTIPPKKLKSISEWGIFSALDNLVNSKALKGFDKPEKGTVRGRHLLTKRGDDANYAGTNKSHLCEAHLVEGDSAEGFDAVLLDYVEGGRNYIGTIVLRGKPLNVLKASVESIKKNMELKEIIIRLGLEFGVDYSDPKNIAKLRYGKVVYLTDSDTDGQHIKILLMAFFHKFFPSLLERSGFIVDFLTPCAIVTRGSQRRRFFFPNQYDAWKNSEDSKGWTVRYLKGLGACEEEDIKECADSKKEVKFTYNEESKKMLEMVMSGGEEYKIVKKAWIREWDPSKFELPKKRKDGTLHYSIKDFINSPVRKYNFDTLERNMNQVSDGLTHVARMILFCSLAKWKTANSKALVKVNAFAGEVSIKTRYHQGDCLSGSIIVMGQDFPGSNNLPLLTRKGRFGSMQKGGKHAAEPRYLEVCASPLLSYIFRKEDDPLLVSVETDGYLCEPERYYPIIPISIINGVEAVCCGWSSFIPNHHPLEVIKAYRARLEGKKFTELEPWYRGYNGRTWIKDGVFISQGTVTEATDDSYTVTSLPVGVWNNKYKNYLLKKVIDGTIEDYKSKCTATKTYFKVKGFKVHDENGERRPINIYDIGITKTRPLNNMVLIGVDGFPVEYKNIIDLQEDFYQFRLSMYVKRKEHTLRLIRERIDKLEKKRKYVYAVYKGKLKFRERRKNDDDSRRKNDDVDKDEPIKRADILISIEKLGLEKGFYVKTPGSGFSVVSQSSCDEEGIKKIDEKLEIHYKELKTETDKPPEDAWKLELDELETQYKKLYKDDERVIVL